MIAGWGSERSEANGVNEQMIVEREGGGGLTEIVSEEPSIETGFCRGHVRYSVCGWVEVVVERILERGAL